MTIDHLKALVEAREDHDLPIDSASLGARFSEVDRLMVRFAETGSVLYGEDVVEALMLLAAEAVACARLPKWR